MKTPKKIFIIAGEASGDLHGANLARALQTESADCPVTLYGVGGKRMQAEGLQEFFDLAHFHATGFTEAIRRIGDYKKAETRIVASLKKVQPDLVILIDNPGFNLHLAEKIHTMQIPIVYYISPQIWAWAPKRIHKIKRLVRKMLVVFEFEEKLYRDHNVDSVWVGHPLKDVLPGNSQNVIKGSSQTPRICLLPGSRKGVIQRLLPIFLGAAKIIHEKLPQSRFFLIKSPTLPVSFYERWLKSLQIPLELVEENSYEVRRTSDLSIVCSGTATTECALLGTPMIISNKGSLLTYLIARALIRVPYLGMPNLILRRMAFPEFLQYEATPEKIAAEATEILSNPARQSQIRQDLAEVSRLLGESGASRRAAQEVLRVLK